MAILFPLIYILFVELQRYICCPIGYSPCSEENTDCNLGAGLISYGNDNSSIYSYQSSTGSISCSNAIFGDPDPDEDKECCIQSPSIHGPLSPIVDVISCNNTIYRFVNNRLDEYYIKLTTTNLNNITYATCDSGFDTTLTVYDSSGSKISEQECPPTTMSNGYGDDCGECGNREIFTMRNQPSDTYYIRISYYGATSSIGDNIFKLNVQCSNETETIITDSPTTNPTNNPTTNPTNTPTRYPTNVPTRYPTNTPTTDPTNAPTKYPTNHPITDKPTNIPTSYPTNKPSIIPTIQPTYNPTVEPTYTPLLESISTLRPTSNNDKLITSKTSTTMSSQYPETILKRSKNQPLSGANFGLIIWIFVLGILSCILCIAVGIVCRKRMQYKTSMKEVEMEKNKLRQLSETVRDSRKIFDTENQSKSYPNTTKDLNLFPPNPVLTYNTLQSSSLHSPQRQSVYSPNSVCSPHSVYSPQSMPSPYHDNPLNLIAMMKMNNSMNNLNGTMHNKMNSSFNGNVLIPIPLNYAAHDSTHSSFDVSTHSEYKECYEWNEEQKSQQKLNIDDSQQIEQSQTQQTDDNNEHNDNDNDNDNEDENDNDNLFNTEGTKQPEANNTSNKQNDENNPHLQQDEFIISDSTDRGTNQDNDEDDEDLLENRHTIF